MKSKLNGILVTIVGTDGEKILTVTITQDWDVNHLLIVQVTVYPFMLLRLFNIREALYIEMGEVCG